MISGRLVALGFFFRGGILLLELKSGGFSKNRGGPPQTEGDFLLWRGIPAARAVFATAGNDIQRFL